MNKPRGKRPYFAIPDDLMALIDEQWASTFPEHKLSRSEWMCEMIRLGVETKMATSQKDVAT